MKVTPVPAPKPRSTTRVPPPIARPPTVAPRASQSSSQTPSLSRPALSQERIVDSDSGSGAVSSGSGEEDDEDASESEDDAPPERQPTASKRTTQRRQSNTPIPPPQSRHTAAPAGYQPLPTPTAAKASQAHRLFRPSNLDGKQLWHITAPATVPISSVTSVALESIKKGEAALTHDGAEYGFVNQGGERKRSRLLVAGEGEGYRAVSRDFDLALNLQQIVRLPRLPSSTTSNSSHASTSTIRTSQPARPHPEGLRMRWQPLGLRDGPTAPVPASSIVAQKAAAVTAFRAPTGVSEEPEGASLEKPRKKKRKHGEDYARGEMDRSVHGAAHTNGAHVDLSPHSPQSPKKKKKRKEKKATPPVEHGTGVDILAPSSPTKTKHVAPAAVNGSLGVETATQSPETKKQKKHREREEGSEHRKKHKQKSALS